MRFEPGFIKELKRDLATIRPDIARRVARVGGLSEQKLLSLVSTTQVDVLNDVSHLTVTQSYEQLASTGVWRQAIDAVRKGEVAFVVLAGGSGTRLGGPKAFVQLPKLGMTLTSIKAMQSCLTGHEGEVVQAPTWFMTSPGLLERMSSHLNGLCPVIEGCVFEQFESYRLRPDNRLSFVGPGVPELQPTGHGDLGPALIESGVLDDNPNVKHCVVVNVDNVKASLDMHVLGHHLQTGSHVTCELVERRQGDEGGVPVWHENRAQIVEAFRLPEGTASSATYHNTNTMIISVEALRTELPWRWHRVRKQVDNRIVVQYERMLQQYTEAFDTQYVLVNREDRYAPVKTPDDLDRVATLLNGNLRL